MAESVMKDYFPSQAVNDDEKLSFSYGLDVAKAIENEWFKKTSGINRYLQNQNNFHKLRLYARGEQSIQKYKDELSINGDLSYLNLDWKPVPIIPKFVDIVVNGISERTFDIKAYTQDPYGVEKRTKYMEGILADMKANELNEFASEAFGLNLMGSDLPQLPENEEELQLHMQLNYKQAVEIAEEQALSVLLDGNRYELTRKKLNYDLTVLGIACVKNSFNTSQGVKVEYVDPANIVYSYTEDPYFEDIYYFGEIRTLPINEIVKEFPELTEKELKDLTKSSHQTTGFYNRSLAESQNLDKNQVQILYFN